MSLLTLTTSQEQEAVHVALEGELDLSSALLFDEELRRIEEDDAAPETVVLDLSTLKFMDSTGLRLLMDLAGAARKDGITFGVLPGDGPPRRLLRITGLDVRLDLREG